MEELLVLIWVVIKILCIVLPLLGAVAYYTMAERKVMGYMQTRIGPNRVGFYGLLQPIADGIKALTKEIIVPSASNKFLFILAPILTIAPALVAWAVVPFQEQLILANINAGVLFILAMTSLGVYGILIAGWSSNSKYAFYGALRGAAQVISYEIAMAFALVCVLIAAGSMNLKEIVLAQQGGLLHWYWLPLLPMLVVYWISGVAETNRLPFDLLEGESEIVAGFHVEYSGITFAVFFLAEYANMILISILTAVFFFGGWLSPFQGVPYLASMFSWIPGIIWLFLKAGFFAFLFLWMRATFPRYRYDQVMRLGWKILIPVTLVWVVVTSLMVKLGMPPWFS